MTFFKKFLEHGVEDLDTSTTATVMPQNWFPTRVQIYWNLYMFEHWIVHVYTLP